MSRLTRPRRRVVRTALGACSAMLALTVAASISEPPPTAEALELATQRFDNTPRPLGPVTVLGDSVLQGSLLWNPTIVHQLAAQGWGPIRARAGVGYSTGHFNVTAEAKTTYWVDLWRRQGWDAPNVFVNLGANDSGRCQTDLACARNAILHLVDAIGPGHQIWWPQITRHPVHQAQADNWNLALRQIADERADFHTWDWPHAMATGGFSSDDNTHLSVSGYQRRSVLMAETFTADIAMATRSGGDAPLAVPTGGQSKVVPVGPVRVIDTREDPPGRVDAQSKIVIDVSEHVPDGTTAVAAYVSATETDGAGFLTAWECSVDRPEASAANHLIGETRGAVAITPVSADGTFCLYTHAEAHLLVDLQAAFVAESADGLQFDPLSTPTRLVDTRETGRRQTLEIEVPDGADAVSVSVAAIHSDHPGFLTVYPCGGVTPLVATVNHGPREVVAGTAYVPVGDDGTICVYSLNPVDVIVDLTGIFSSTGELVFQPVEPTRMLDTRVGIGGWSPIHGPDQTLDVRVAPSDARAVSGTLTLVTPTRPGFLTAWGCGTRPPTSNLNAETGQILANSVTTGVSDSGRLCIRSHSPTSTLFDANGWWVPAG